MPELDCKNGFQTIETEIESQKIVSYKIIYSKRIYTEESSDFYEGIIVLPDLNDQISPQEIMETIARIGVKNKLSKILAFKTCQAIEIYGQETELTLEQKKYLEANQIAKLEIDLEKTLSKDDKKRNKLKSKLIQSLSQKTCDDLKKLNSKDLSMEQFNQSMIKIMVPNTEKIEKVYGKYIDEILGEFTEDLIHELNKDCGLVQKLTREFKHKTE